MYDELFDLPEEMTSADEEVTSHDLWMLAGHLTNAHNTAKANKQAVRYFSIIFVQPFLVFDLRNQRGFVGVLLD